MKLTSIKADRSPLIADRKGGLVVNGKHLTVNILYQTRSGAGRGE